MPTTPIFAFPYPALTDPPNGAAQIQALAEAVEAELNGTNSDVTSLTSRVTVLENLYGTAVAVADSDTAISTTSSAAYTESWGGSNTPSAVAFVAPPSGKVIIHNSSYVDNNNATGYTYLSWILRNGAVIGSGTTVALANDGWALVTFGVAGSAQGRATLVTGLTGGNSYNVRQAMKVVGGQAESQFRHLAVEPVLK
jgi:hypothetical protein